MSIIRGKAAGAIVAGFLATSGHTALGVADHKNDAWASDSRDVAAVAKYLKEHDGQTILSAEGYKRLAASEAMSTLPYFDGAGVLTVCFGETKGVQRREYSPEECAAMLVLRVEGHFGPRVRDCTAPWAGLHQETRDSLIEFAYNIGTHGYCVKSSVRKRLDAGRGADSCVRMLAWNKKRVNGALEPDKGLTNRRKREAWHCENGFAKQRTA